MSMELKLNKDLISITETPNPFKTIVTESGIYLGIEGVAHSDETGNLEKLEQIIGFGVITRVGPLCQTAKVGDGVYYDRRSLQPITFNDVTWVLPEGNVRGFVEDDGTLQDLIKEREEQAKAEAFKNGLAMNAPLGATAITAGQPGSGLKLV